MPKGLETPTAPQEALIIPLRIAGLRQLDFIQFKLAAQKPSQGFSLFRQG